MTGLAIAIDPFGSCSVYKAMILVRASQLLALTLFVLLAGHGSARANDFVTMPGAKGAQKDIQLKMLRYEGSTNGVMVVQVKNTARTNREFAAAGLFFVPEGNPEEAPQRLGASGPFTEIAKGKQLVHQEKMTLAAGEIRTVELEVFCIDSHRSSPSSETKFAIAQNKLPRSLQRELKSSNGKIYKENKGDLRKAKSAVQSNMWHNRDKDWIKLEGERANEKAPRNKNAPHHRPIRHQQKGLNNPL